MLDVRTIEKRIAADFDEMDFTDKPMENFCAYQRTKHIQMATQLVLNAFSWKMNCNEWEVDDMIHGLNHLFFNGVNAGQWFAYQQNK